MTARMNAMNVEKSVLETDGYKLSMAEAGWPLRPETFVYQHRKGGAQVVPLDVGRFVREHLPVANDEDLAYLVAHGYEMGAGFKAAISRHGAVTVDAVPKGGWFLPREPVFSVSGPSALVSWLEPLLLQLSYRIQVATLALADAPALARAVAVVTCEAQRAIVHPSGSTKRGTHVASRAARASSPRRPARARASSRWACARRAARHSTWWLSRRARPRASSGRATCSARSSSG
jgi:nicotinic acid phosphoribosyltransferase